MFTYVDLCGSFRFRFHSHFLCSWRLSRVIHVFQCNFSIYLALSLSHVTRRTNPTGFLILITSGLGYDISLPLFCRFSLSLYGCAIFVFIFRIYAYLFRHTPNLRYCRRFIPFLCYYCYFNGCYMEIYFGLVLGNKFLCMSELLNFFSV